MHHRADSAVIILSLLLGLSLSNTHGDAQHDISHDHHFFCHRTSSLGDGLTRLTFLREMMAGDHRSLLYQTVWSEEDMRLVRCSISDDPAVTDRYLTLCDGTESTTTDTGEGQVNGFNISVLLAEDGPCALDSKLTKPGGRIRSINWVDDRPQSVVKSRRKRSWLFPGTLWCGTGSTAVGYEQLGMFESVDRCCREHDHCKSTIHAFRRNYGVFNSNFFTVSHCDCDQRFRQCLLSVNDPISSMVGYSFFNILRVPCFHVVRQRRCTEMYWWGLCKVAGEAPYAVFQKPMPYNSTKYDVTGASHKSTRTKARDGMERPRTSRNRNPPKGEHRKPSVPSGRCTPRVPSRGDTVQWKKRKGKGCKRSSKTPATATSAPSTRTPGSLLQTTATLASQPKTAVTAAASEFHPNVSSGNKSGENKGSRMKHKSQASSRATMKPRQRATTPRSSSPMTQRGAFQPQTTFPTATTITTTGKKRQRCGPRLPVRGDTFQSRRKPCADRKTRSHTSAAKVSPTEKTSAILWNSTTTTTSSSTTTTIATAITSIATTITKPIKIKLRSGLLTQTTMPVAQRGNFPKQTNTYPPRDGTNQEMAAITDNLTLCGTLKHLDDCKHKIQPLEKKYNLQNMESKIVYHCDCTSRLAGQIENFRTPNILRSLLMDFVSENCLSLPKKGKNCSNRKSSCAAGFSKASRLFQALKKIEERSTAGDQKLDRDVKRAIPVRLYKRCLKILHPRKRG